MLLAIINQKKQQNQYGDRPVAAIAFAVISERTSSTILKSVCFHPNMSEYEACAKGPLKIKGDSGIKKKKKKKDKKKLLEQVSKIVESVENEDEKPQNDFELTKAELAFIKQQEKMQEERIKKKASMTHKQRVEEFNKHLDSLTEHFDIPKVSWTK